jgi:hypothetical protein
MDETTHNSITGQSDIKKIKLQNDAPKTDIPMTGEEKHELKFSRTNLKENNAV